MANLMNQTLKIDYDHTANVHTLNGARTAFQNIVGDWRPVSVLDVGCGKGSWVRAAMDSGITDVFGIDGIDVGDHARLFPRSYFQQQDLTERWSLSRKFDLALCLEVGEHLSPQVAGLLVESLVAHSDVVVFSGACPGQAGQHHVNCQWPDYWQRLFNAQGYVCDDAVRWRIWDISEIEPWYRQNVFVASKSPQRAGGEPRIKQVIHPSMVALGAINSFHEERKRYLTMVEGGSQPAMWYLATSIKACTAKFKRALSRAGRPHR